ncbi:MAG: hypothetical protein KIT84_37335 [Labilithrix sp.]|nr:hypothetical protein [Labilithrix sp.]MCW5816723.1 hypothetical protein [Labilithrix sp.]
MTPGSEEYVELGPPLDVSTFELSLLGAEAFVSCSADGERIAHAGYGGVVGMAAYIDANYRRRFRRPGIAITQAQIDACTAKLRDADCSAGLAAFVACDFRGTLADGAGCRDDLQCASGHCTSSISPMGGTGDCGVCKPRAPLGATCGNGTWCDSGLVCDDDETCKAPVPIGASCANAPCDRRSYCESGTCQPLRREGETCRTNRPDGVDYGNCWGRNRCRDGVCTAPKPVTLLKHGEACGDYEDDTSFLVCNSGACDKETKRCVPYEPRREVTTRELACK